MIIAQDFGCTYIAYIWTSRDDKVIFPPNLYFLPVISGSYFKIILHIFISGLDGRATVKVVKCTRHALL